jgi:hypothetical protein
MYGVEDRVSVLYYDDPVFENISDKVSCARIVKSTTFCITCDYGIKLSLMHDMSGLNDYFHRRELAILLELAPVEVEVNAFNSTLVVVSMLSTFLPYLVVVPLCVALIYAHLGVYIDGNYLSRMPRSQFTKLARRWRRLKRIASKMFATFELDYFPRPTYLYKAAFVHFSGAR